jgi:Putative zincin peptidase
MFFIPGQVIAMLTFPGIIVHETAHLFFCKLFKLKVFDVCFFRVGNPAGYVVHENSSNFTAQFFVSMGPFVINTLLCVIFCTAAFLPVWELKVVDPLAYFFYWLGLSIGMHAFPSTMDLSHLWKAAPPLAKKGNLLAILSLPLCGLLVILNYARVIWADLGYGIAVGVLGPIAIFRAYARF